MDQDPNTSTKNSDILNYSPPNYILVHHKSKSRSVRFVYPHNHTNTMDNNIIDAHEEHIREDDEQE